MKTRPSKITQGLTGNGGLEYVTLRVKINLENVPWQSFKNSSMVKASTFVTVDLPMLT